MKAIGWSVLTLGESKVDGPVVYGTKAAACEHARELARSHPGEEFLVCALRPKRAFVHVGEAASQAQAQTPDAAEETKATPQAQTARAAEERVPCDMQATDFGLRCVAHDCWRDECARRFRCMPDGSPIRSATEEELRAQGESLARTYKPGPRQARAVRDLPLSPKGLGFDQWWLEQCSALYAHSKRDLAFEAWRASRLRSWWQADHESGMAALHDLCHEMKWGAPGRDVFDVTVSEVRKLRAYAKSALGPTCSECSLPMTAGVARKCEVTKRLCSWHVPEYLRQLLRELAR